MRNSLAGVRNSSAGVRQIPDGLRYCTAGMSNSLAWVRNSSEEVWQGSTGERNSSAGDEMKLSFDYEELNCNIADFFNASPGSNLAFLKFFEVLCKVNEYISLVVNRYRGTNQPPRLLMSHHRGCGDSLVVHLTFILQSRVRKWHSSTCRNMSVPCWGASQGWH